MIMIYKEAVVTEVIIKILGDEHMINSILVDVVEKGYIKSYEIVK